MAESNLLSYISPIGELLVEAMGGVISTLSIRNTSVRAKDEVVLEEPCLGLFKLFDRYFMGERVDFNSVEVALSGTPFQRRIWSELRSIPYGKVLSYRELAVKAGFSKGSARAVGSACARNPVPIVIPCHRVVGARGVLGGYSAGTGVDIKRRLLDLESSL